MVRGITKEKVMFDQDLQEYEIFGVIPNEDKADGLLWHYSQVEQERQRISDLAQAQIDKIMLWKENELHKISGKTEWLSNGLREFLATTGKKSMKLPNGTLQTRKSPDKYVYEDEQTFMELHPNFVREKVVVSLDKTAVKKAVKETGEIPDGLDIVEGTTTFSIKL